MKKRDILQGNGPMNLYLLRVGADSIKLGGGFYSHISPKDRSYIFIPIPECRENLTIKKAFTYQDYIQSCKWKNQQVLDYLPLRIRKSPDQYYVHNDPEFDTFTYGSPKLNQNGITEKNYKTLAEIMQKGDMLTFYAACISNGHGIEGYYFFAYFIVDRTITFCNQDGLTKKERNLVGRNHHFIHIDALQNEKQVIVKGDPERSRVFERAVFLSSPKYREESNYRPCPFIQDLLGGYKNSMNMSSIRKIPLSKDGIDKFKNHLDKSGGCLKYL